MIYCTKCKSLRSLNIHSPSRPCATGRLAVPAALLRCLRLPVGRLRVKRCHKFKKGLAPVKLCEFFHSGITRSTVLVFFQRWSKRYEMVHYSTMYTVITLYSYTIFYIYTIDNCVLINFGISMHIVSRRKSTASTANSTWHTGNAAGAGSMAWLASFEVQLSHELHEFYWSNIKVSGKNGPSLLGQGLPWLIHFWRLCDYPKVCFL